MSLDIEHHSKEITRFYQTVLIQVEKKDLGPTGVDGDLGDLTRKAITKSYMANGVKRQKGLTFTQQTIIFLSQLAINYIEGKSQLPINGLSDEVSKTRNYFVKFQKEHGISPSDGWIRESTRSKIIELLKKKKPIPPDISSEIMKKFGDDKELVGFVQQIIEMKHGDELLEETFIDAVEMINNTFTPDALEQVQKIETFIRICIAPGKMLSDFWHSGWVFRKRIAQLIGIETGLEYSRTRARKGVFQIEEEFLMQDEKKFEMGKNRLGQLILEPDVAEEEFNKGLQSAASIVMRIYDKVDEISSRLNWSPEDTKKAKITGLDVQIEYIEDMVMNQK